MKYKVCDLFCHAGFYGISRTWLNTPWTVVHQTQSMEISRQEYWCVGGHSLLWGSSRSRDWHLHCHCLSHQGNPINSYVKSIYLLPRFSRKIISLGKYYGRKSPTTFGAGRLQWASWWHSAAVWSRDHAITPPLDWNCFSFGCRILMLRPGIEPMPSAWKHGILTTGRPANSPSQIYLLVKWNR